MASASEATLHAIAAVLGELDGHPEESRQMMSRGLPLAFAAASAARHEYQAQFLTLVEDALKDGQRAAAEQEAEQERLLEDERAALEAKKASAAQAAAAAENCAEAAAEKEQLLGQARQRAKEAERDHNKTERDTAGVKKHYAQLQGEKETLAFVIDCSLKMLEEGGCEDDEAQNQAVEGVLARLKDEEKVLLAAAEPALRTKVEDRKPFDQVTLTHLRGVLESQALSIGTQVEEWSGAARQAEAEVLGVWALADVARDHVAQAENAHGQAQAAAEAAQQAQQQAEEAADSQGARVEAAVAALALAGEKARRVAGAASAFQELMTAPAEPPPPEEEDVEMAAAEDQAPAASPKQVEGSPMPMDVAASPKDVAASPKVNLGCNALGVPTPMAV